MTFFTHFQSRLLQSAQAKQALDHVAPVLLALAMVVALAPMQASAGAGGTEFTQVYDQLTGWSNGTLGKVLGIAALLVGLGVGVIKQSVIAAVVGIAMALTAGFGPGVIDGVISTGMAITTPI